MGLPEQIENMKVIREAISKTTDKKKLAAIIDKHAFKSGEGKILNKRLANLYELLHQEKFELKPRRTGELCMPARAAIASLRDGIAEAENYLDTLGMKKTVPKRGGKASGRTV